MFSQITESALDYHATLIALDLFVIRTIAYPRSYLWDLRQWQKILNKINVSANNDKDLKYLNRSGPDEEG
jgi:hypothetical protein